MPRTAKKKTTTESPAVKKKPPVSHNRNDQNRDDQIIALLNLLGNRLIVSEKERGELKEKLEDVENKTDQSEKAFLTLHDKMSKTESAGKNLAEKIDETIAQQSRLNRRMDKVTKDRARMIRKLENIEETVNETQEALNSKALVLMADQAKALQAAGQPEAEPGPWWHRPVRIQEAAVMTAVITLAVMAGWGIGHIGSGGTTTDKNITAAIDIAESSIADPADTATNEQYTADTFTLGLKDGTQSALPAFDTPPKIDRIDNVLTMSDEDLLANLEENPDALAAALNEIAPAAHPVPDKPEEVVEEKEQRATPASFTQKESQKETANGDIENFVSRQRTNNKLTDRIKPDENLPTVIKEIEDKAFEGIAEAQHDLAAIYTAGHGGVKKDYKKAAMWFTEAGAQGIANARYNLGVLYHQGLGVDQDVSKAIGWYRAAAQLGHPEAQYNLGIAHIEGIGTEYNPRLAANFFEQAANSGILEAAYNLGLIYENGLLGNSRPQEALRWYKKAADQGSPEAQTALEQLAKTMKINIKDIPSEKSANTNIPPEQKKQAAAPVPRAERMEIITPGPLYPEITVTAEEPQRQRNYQDQAIIAQIQEQLMIMGLYPGPVDGVRGPVTEDAIRAYQSQNKLNRDGRPSEALLVHMLTSEMTATIAPTANEEEDLLPPGEFGSRAE